MNHPIHFVSLGPGDPELITLKGLKTLQKADIIYCPATQGKHGIISRATDILKAIEVDESLIIPFSIFAESSSNDAVPGITLICSSCFTICIPAKAPAAINAGIPAIRSTGIPVSSNLSYTYCIDE